MYVVPVALTLFLASGCAFADPDSPPSVSELFRRTSPAVVVVRTIQSEPAPPSRPGAPATVVSVPGLGSGVLVQTGTTVKVLTAAHVVQTAERVLVELADGRSIKARVAASATLADVALLELDVAPQDIRPAPLGDSDAVSVGDAIFVVGAPYGLSSSLSVGYIGARRRSKEMIGSFHALELFQTDAAINTGNSGGPMFNMKGEVVGIVSHILTRSGGFEGTGFAVTSNLARRVLLEAPSLWSGIDSLMLSEDLAGVLNVPQPAGLLVQRMSSRSPGARLGLRAGTQEARVGGQELLVGGDIVLSIAGLEVEARPAWIHEVQAKVRGLGDDDTLVVKVLRGGSVTELSAPMRDLRP